ncbi:hypothetical protein Tco_0937199 [Tanacetum coccineum]|uniref:Uncharacterized protein n=1 Tax=Tanacetum coccineum TaxID=301880 RepID=A0ABQ5DJT0_9ASTR
MESLNSNSQERELYQLQQMQHKAKESCMKSFRLLQSHLQVLSYNDLKNQLESRNRHFANDSRTRCTELSQAINVTKLGSLKSNHDKDESKKINLLLHLGAQQSFRDKLIQHMENVKKFVAKRARHQRQYERRVNNRQIQMQESKIDTGSALDVDPCKALDASLVVTVTAMGQSR